MILAITSQSIARGRRWPARVKTEGVVLRSMRFGEADRILHLYTPQRGQRGRDRQGRAARAQPLRRAPGAVLPARPRAARGPQRPAHRDRAPRPSRATRACASDAGALDTRRARLRRGRAAVRHRRAAPRRLQPALQRARAARQPSRRAPGTRNQLAFRLKLLLAAGLRAAAGGVRLVRRGASTSVGLLAARPAASCAAPARRARSRSTQEAHASWSTRSAGRWPRRRRPTSARCARPSARSPRRSSTTRDIRCAPRRGPVGSPAQRWRRNGSTTSPRARRTCATCSAARAPTSPR